MSARRDGKRTRPRRPHLYNKKGDFLCGRARSKGTKNLPSPDRRSVHGRRVAGRIGCSPGASYDPNELCPACVRVYRGGTSPGNPNMEPRDGPPLSKKAPAHAWQNVTSWKTWSHDWCERCGTIRVTMAGTGVSYFNVPSNSSPCGGRLP